jgi:lysozyme family protein
MTETDVINSILEREGGYVNRATDRGGPTNFGITAASWGVYRNLGRIATAEEVRAISHDEAIGFYHQWLGRSPFATITYEPLRLQLIDFGILSGDERATRWLQRVLGVVVTGSIDARTLRALEAVPQRMANDALVAARLYMDKMIVDSDPSQKEFSEGWERRALQFFLSKPEAI